jgi:hypothetical protein
VEKILDGGIGSRVEKILDGITSKASLRLSSSKLGTVIASEERPVSMYGVPLTHFTKLLKGTNFTTSATS